MAGQVEQGPAAHDVDPRDDGGVEVGVERIAEGRHEEALAARPLLVHVPIDLREPGVVQQLRDDAGLGLGQHEPVAVVVVARVVLVELEQLRGLVGRPHRAAVPAHDMVEPVGVERGEEPDDHVLSRSGPRLLVGGRQAMRELHRELRGGRLRGVHGAGDEQEDLALLDRLASLGVAAAARVGDRPGVALQAVELGQVLGAGDDREQELAALGGRAHRHGQHPRALLGEPLEVAADLLPVGQLEVHADRSAEVRLGRGDRLSAGEARGRQGHREGDERDRVPAHAFSSRGRPAARETIYMPWRQAGRLLGGRSRSAPGARSGARMRIPGRHSVLARASCVKA